MANHVINLGFYVSLPGMVTFKNAVTARQVAGGISIDDLLLETDSPYLAPVPHRGKRNEPANIPLIAAKIAELQHLTLNDVERETTYNAFDLFGIGEPGPLDAA
jgi:TatD DNase family protein